MRTIEQHSFWGSLSPLGGLMGMGLLIMSSARLSWAIITALGLFWVYGLTVFTFSFLLSTGKKFIPKLGRVHLFTCLASFFGSVYLLLFWILCPFAVFETFVPLLLIPLYCANCGTYERLESFCENSGGDIFDSISDAISQAAILAGLLIVFSIIREPLSYCSLSFPGTSQGMITIMYFKAGSFFPIGIFAASSGALLMLGFFVCLYQYSKNIFFPGDIENE